VSWNPFNTLTGRMVLVTIVAVVISWAGAFAIYANERGAALRRAAELAAAERIAFTYERLRDAPPALREGLAEQVRDYSIRYRVGSTATHERAAAAGPAARVSRAIVERLGDDVAILADSRTVKGPSRRWRRHREAHAGGEIHPPRRGPPAEDGPIVSATEVGVSLQLDERTWLNARARLPGPRPAPLGVLAGGIVSVIIVGIGAALVSRQIGRPLADLAAASQALGAGQANVDVRVSGPDDVRRAATAFNAMAARLGRQLNRQRQMLWALSHDLRTPLTALRLRAEFVEDDAMRQRLLAPIEEMERLTEQALALARAGASEEARAHVDLAEIARTLCGELQDMGMDIRADAPEAVHVEIRPSEIARALRNLAENAAKYGGGGVMRVSRNAAGEAVAEVSDNGPGVPPALLNRLTEPFFRADAARGEANGAGLGLAIAQAIADGHGGRLTFENRVPRGFTAKLILPG